MVSLQEINESKYNVRGVCMSINIVIYDQISLFKETTEMTAEFLWIVTGHIF